MAFASQAVNTLSPLPNSLGSVRPRSPCAAPAVHSRACRSHVVLASGAKPVPAALGCSGLNGSAAAAPKALSINLDKWPQADFIRVEAIMRPWRLEDVVHDLSKNGIVGMTASNVMGVGVQGGTRERYGGKEHGVENLVAKTKLEVVCFRDQVDAVVNIMCEAARTGEIGDGKIFVSPVADVVRIRTGETGDAGERMAGGMADRMTGESDNEGQ